MSHVFDDKRRPRDRSSRESGQGTVINKSVNFGWEKTMKIVTVIQNRVKLALELRISSFFFRRATATAAAIDPVS